MSEPSPPGPAAPLPGAARARIATRSLTELSLLTAIVVACCAWLAAEGQGTVALGLALGHVTGALIAASWIVATAATWSARDDILMRFTIGAWPLRMAAFVVGALVATALEASGGAFLFALVGTHVVGTLIEARTLAALTRIGKSR